jgi:hypothetical protein
MIKEEIFHAILLLFFGILFVYLTHKDPSVICKHPNINDTDNDLCSK